MKNLRIWLLACICILACVACSSASHEGASGGTGSDAGSGEGSPSLGTPPLVTDPDATAMAISLSLVSDSSGMTPASGDAVEILFEPPNTVHLLALDANDPANSLSFQGTYTMTATNLTVSFTASGFVRSGSVAFDATKATLTLPFQVFSSDKGTSAWNRNVALISQNAQDLFSSLSAASPLNLSLEQRSSRVFDWVTHYVAVHADVAAQALRQNTLAPHIALGLPWFIAPYITGCYLSSDGTEFVCDYSDGSQSSTIVYQWEPLGATTLTVSPLASDPRIALSVTPATDDANPPNKTALFIAPFDAMKYYAHYPLASGGTAEGTVYGFHQDDNLSGAQSVLEDAGYKVQNLLNEDATVPAIVNALTGPTPGYIYYSTHGGSNGFVGTGQFLGYGFDDAYQALQGVFATLRNTNHLGDLLDYEVTTGDIPKTLGYMCVTASVGTTKGDACYVALTPYFWKWLHESRGVDFRNSLFMMGACLTDHNPDLRSWIGARAYFDYTITIPGPFSGAVFQYFGKTLARHTHSAEESYYNVLRVVNSGQMVYPEDELFNNLTNFNVKNGVDVQGAFHGWFPNGGTMVDYQKAGWLDEPAGGGASGNANPGYIWLLLSAGRWGGNAKQGGNNLADCWKTAWSKGTTGDTGTWCAMAAPGQAAKQGEVAYAGWLLTGESGYAGMPLAESPVARWTLNDP
jgi:hypothetical protein